MVADQVGDDLVVLRLLRQDLHCLAHDRVDVVVDKRESVAGAEEIPAVDPVPVVHYVPGRV